jgi:prefoldin subunit 5
MNPEDELQMLRNEADAIKSDLDGINKRIEELESKSSQS